MKSMNWYYSAPIEIIEEFPLFGISASEIKTAN